MFDVGSHLVPVRTTDEEVGEALSSLLGDFEVAVAEPPQAYYSIAVERPPRERRGGKNLYQLYRCRTLVMKSRNLRRVLVSLLRRIAGHLDAGRDGSASARVNGMGLALGSEGVVVSGLSNERWLRLDPRLAAAGVESFDAPWCEIDLERGELVYRDLPFPARADTLDAPEDASGSGDGTRRFRLRRWIMLRPEEGEGEVTGARAVVGAVNAMWDPWQRMDPEAVVRLMRLTEEKRPLELCRGTSAPDMARVVLRELGAPGEG